MNIASLLQNVIIEEKPVCKSERSQLIKDIYEIYTSTTERNIRKMENWKRYVAFLKSMKMKDSEMGRSLFKRSKQYIKEEPITTIIFFTSHIPKDDLYYVKSVMKDCNNRGTSSAAWLFSNTIKKQ